MKQNMLKAETALCLLALTLAGCTGASPGPNTADANVLNVADAAVASDNPDMALSISQSVLAHDPDNLQALYHEGAAYYALDRCEDAMAAYRVALKVDPKSSEAETGIGRCLLRRNAIEAEQAFNAAVQDDPGNAEAFNDLGIARDLQGHYAAASDAYQQSLQVSPGMTATEVNLGLSLALSGQAADALEYLGPLATSDQATPKIRADYAMALYAAGRTEEARQVLSADLPPDKVNQEIGAFAALVAQPQAAAPEQLSSAAPD